MDDNDDGASENGTKSTAPRFAFITPSGWGNLGDAAIVDSLIHAIRERVPGARIVGYTLNHADTSQRHGVEAGPLTGFSVPFYPVLPADVGEGFDPPGYDGTDVPADRPQDARARLRSMLRAHMWSVRAIGLLTGAVRARHGAALFRRRRHDVAGTDAIVVAGGGQLDALFGGAWGQPFVLWQWARLARAVNSRFLVLSVGTGTLDPLERAITARALRLATYRSYRDEDSRTMIRRPELTAADPVVPDLAYALPTTPRAMPRGERLVVGVSPMNYQHPDFYPAADPSRYEQHVDGVHRICERLLERDIDVLLFTTDASDDVGLADVATRLRRSSNQPAGRWSIAGAATVEDLMEMYGAVHAVVASRLHGALLAHVAHRPVLALAHERKVRRLMTDVGHERFCFDLGHVDDVELDRRLEELLDRRDELSAEVAAAADAMRRLVDAQYDAVFGVVDRD